jgi:hypothetical protein
MPLPKDVWPSGFEKPDDDKIDFTAFRSPEVEREFIRLLSEATNILAKVVSCREKALVITKLEEAIMWAEKIPGSNWR